MKDDISGLVKLVKEARTIAMDQLSVIQIGINDLVRNYDVLRGKGVEGVPIEREIETYLDTLLSCIGLGVGEKEFFDLLTFYQTINPDAANDYRKFYQEIFVDEEKLD